MIESEASVKGRVVAEMLSHFTNDLKIGKKIKSGELRKRMIEPPWIPPAMFNLTWSIPCWTAWSLSATPSNFRLTDFLRPAHARC